MDHRDKPRSQRISPEVTIHMVFLMLTLGQSP